MTGIDAVERYLVCQLAQVTLYPIAEDYVDRWRAAMESGNALPDMPEIIEAAARGGRSHPHHRLFRALPPAVCEEQPCSRPRAHRHCHRPRIR